MRSTISIRALLLAPFWALLAAAACAQAGSEPGCYTRFYSDAHLAGHPEQVVGSMTLSLDTDDQGERVAWMEVATSGQGHAAQFGQQLFGQGLICWQSGGRTGCSVECDGGSFHVIRQDAETLLIETDYLMVGDTEECGGAFDIAERPGEPTRYLLRRADKAVCEGP